jgi:uncharacterized protein DUF955
VFTRGFKSWCENVAIQQRRALSLLPTDPLDPRKLAQQLKVHVRRVEDIPGLDPQYRRILLYEDADSWSAVTISEASKRIIVLNSSHAQTRLASDLMHELAHILIDHEPARIDLTQDGSLMLSTYSSQQEEEANWLAGSLLLPRDAVFLIRRRGVDLELAAKKYGTSMDMLQFRINVTGVDHQLRRMSQRSFVRRSDQ